MIIDHWICPVKHAIRAMREGVRLRFVGALPAPQRRDLPATQSMSLRGAQRRSNLRPKGRDCFVTLAMTYRTHSPTKISRTRGRGVWLAYGGGFGPPRSLFRDLGILGPAVRRRTTSGASGTLTLRNPHGPPPYAGRTPGGCVTTSRGAPPMARKILSRINMSLRAWSGLRPQPQCSPPVRADCRSNPGRQPGTLSPDP